MFAIFAAAIVFILCGFYFIFCRPEKNGADASPTKVQKENEGGENDDFIRVL